MVMILDEEDLGKIKSREDLLVKGVVRLNRVLPDLIRRHLYFFSDGPYERAIEFNRHYASRIGVDRLASYLEGTPFELPNYRELVETAFNDGFHIETQACNGSYAYCKIPEVGMSLTGYPEHLEMRIRGREEGETLFGRINFEREVDLFLTNPRINAEEIFEAYKPFLLSC
ncbi:MAG: hypothetical protein ACOCXG_04870 [Nanoarchaeota archaeon]